MTSRDKGRGAPKTKRQHVNLGHPSTSALKPESKECLERLRAYRPPHQRLKLPRTRSAAVLVALFIGRMGDIYVLLSRRASTLRTYAGDTSLPGGKWEQGDRTLEWTARREAFEEIGLPLDNKATRHLCTLEPFLAGNQLIVTPVVVLIMDQTIRPILNESEVDSIFSHPLASLLSKDSPYPHESETLEVKYHTHRDINWGGNPSEKVRMHSFLTGREAGGTKPIFGLTAAILIRVAAIGYGRSPDFDLFAPGQRPQEIRIAATLKYHPTMREAAIKEGIDPDRSADPVLKSEWSLDTTSHNLRRKRERRRVRSRL